MEVNPLRVGFEFVQLLQAEFPNYTTTETSSEHLDKLVAKELLSMFYAILTDCVVEEDSELFDDKTTSTGSSYSQEPLQDDNGLDVNFEVTDNCPIQRKTEILKLISKNPNWSLTTIQRKGGAELKHANYKSRWERQVASGGSKYEKFSFIEDSVYEKYTTARLQFHAVRTSHLRLWTLQAAQTFQDPSFQFKASRSWLSRFKSRKSISSRKVTKLVSRRNVRSLDSIVEAGKNFQKEVLAISKQYDPDYVLNTDQTGFAYELVPNRTVATQKEKRVFVVAQSPTNLVTHSYTVQYLISQSGHVVGDVFLCMQEKSGKFGPIVQEGLFQAPNVTVTCSTSGKLTTSLVDQYYDTVLLKAVKKDFLLILDSWSGQTNQSLYERFGSSGNPSCTLKIIPESCTSTSQLLDTYFHLQLKYYAKAISAEALMHNAAGCHPEDEITTRNNTIRTHSLLHNPFSAKIFEPMIRYCFFSADLLEEKPMFENVREACFTFGDETLACATSSCEMHRFVKCAHCRKNYCFPCFYYEYHFRFESTTGVGSCF